MGVGGGLICLLHRLRFVQLLLHEKKWTVLRVLTALFTKPPVSWFPALPGTMPPFHRSIRDAVNGGTASGGRSCRQYFWEWPVTKEPTAL